MILIKANIFSTFTQQAHSLLARNQLEASWSPWEPSPLFLQQRFSLTSSTPDYLQRSTSSISNSSAKIISQQTPHLSMAKPKGENVDSFPSEKSPARRKLKTLNPADDRRMSEEKSSTDDYKYLSNNLPILDVGNL